MKIVIVKCAGCGKKREIKEGEIKANDFPMCDVCFMPMFPFKAINRQAKED